MSYLKLAWSPRSQPGRTTNPYVSERIKYEIDRLTERAEEMLAMAPVHVLFDEAERDSENTRFYYGFATYCSYKVTSGDQAVEILNWWRERGYRAKSFRDDEVSGSRDYRMENRDNPDIQFSMFVYFTGDECTFVIEHGEDGEPIVDHVEQAIDARVVYKRKLVCGGSAMPEAEAEPVS